MEMKFDPMTGEPIQTESEPKAPEMKFDPMTGQPIQTESEPKAVSFRRHLPVKLSHWHRPTDSVGRLLFCPPHPGERDPMPPVCAAAPR